jgi:hypothetical protein
MVKSKRRYEQGYFYSNTNYILAGMIAERPPASRTATLSTNS